MQQPSKEEEKKILIELEKTNPEEYKKQLIIYRAKHTQISSLIKKAKEGDELWVAALELKKVMPKTDKKDFSESLKDSNYVLFIKGESHIYLIDEPMDVLIEGQEKMIKYPLKFNGKDDVPLDYTKTQQYRRLSEIGFTTGNGRSYHYDDGVINIWLQMKLSRINKLKVNDVLVNMYSLRIR